MLTRKGLGALVTLILWWAALAAPASAAQLRPATDPTVAGSLTLQTSHCDKDQNMDGGRLAAVAKACIRFYTLDPSNENDPTNDYGILWLQTFVDAGDGYCAYSATSDILIPDGATPLGQAPAAGFAISASMESTTHLDATAGGTIVNPASVEQTFTVYPEQVRVGQPDATTRRLKWKGHTRRPVAFATGVEISWDAVAGRPHSARYGLDYNVAAADRCRAR